MDKNYQTRNNFFQNLAKALVYWLNYMSAICKEDIFKEELLRIPFSEYIERTLTGKIYIENQLNEDNTNKHVDFKYSARVDGCKFKGVVEVKYVQGLTRTSREQKRYFDDLCRLALVNGYGSDNLFVVFGPKTMFMQNFKRLVHGNKKQVSYNRDDQGVVPEGIYSQWLGFEMNSQKTVVLSEFKDFKDNFCKHHKGLNFSKLKTELVAYHEDCSNMKTNVVAIWKIRKTK